MSCGALKGANTGISRGEVQKAGVLDLVGTVLYPPSHCAMCKRVGSEKNCDHINHLEWMGSLLHSEGTNKQGQMGSLPHSWSK